MFTLGNQLTMELRSGMTLPEPLEDLFLWIEQRGMFVDEDSRRIGLREIAG